MQKKMILRLSKVMASVVLLSLHSCSYAVVTYIPQALRDCVSMVHAMAEKKDNANNMAELYSMIEENRILTSDTMVRKAVEEVFHILEILKEYYTQERTRISSDCLFHSFRFLL